MIYQKNVIMLITAAVLEDDISVKEVTEAIRKMQSGKSPGPDGYP